MAISTFKTFLMKSDDGRVYNKLVDIKEFPDLGGEPENLETTTLSDAMQTFIQGIQSMDGLRFPTNYDKAKYQEISKLKGKNVKLAVWFGGTESGGVVTPTGSEGKFEFEGQVSVYVNGGGVNEVVGMTVAVSPSTPIVMGAEE